MALWELSSFHRAGCRYLQQSTHIPGKRDLSSDRDHDANGEWGPYPNADCQFVRQRWPCLFQVNVAAHGIGVDRRNMQSYRVFLWDGCNLHDCYIVFSQQRRLELHNHVESGRLFYGRHSDYWQRNYKYYCTRWHIHHDRHRNYKLWNICGSRPHAVGIESNPFCRS